MAGQQHGQDNGRQRGQSAPQNGQNGQQAALAETTSAKFVASVEKHFTAEIGDALAWTDYEKTLAQHMFLKVDAQLKALEAKREEQNRTNATPLRWENVNMAKLALDTVHRVSLGLDALIPNHIHPIPYWNKRLKKYDIDLRVGYVGKDLCRRKLAVEEPLEVRYELVYETDVFVPHVKSMNNEVENYEFRITNPFDRGRVIGGFGYIRYADPTKNRLVLVTERDFKKAEAGAQTKDFWADNKWREEMMFKTVVHRVADKLPLDPRKVNSRSYAYIEAQEAEESFEREVEGEANYRLIDVETEDQDTDASEPPADDAGGQADAPAELQAAEAQPAEQPQPKREPAASGAGRQARMPGF